MATSLESQGKEIAKDDIGMVGASDTVRMQSAAEGTTVTKGRWERTWPVLAAGAGLFSDGYLNNVCTSYPQPTSQKGKPGLPY